LKVLDAAAEVAIRYTKCRQVTEAGPRETGETIPIE